MASMTCEKRNNAGRSHSGWLVRPLNLHVFGEARFSAVERIILSALYTFSVKDFCKFTYSELKTRYRVSDSSIYRTLKKALTCRFSRGDRKCCYSFTGDREKAPLYIKIEEWIYFATFQIGDETCFLSNTEIEILSLLRDYNRRRWSTSQNYVADQLGISPSTASTAFSRLIRAGLITPSSASGAHAGRAVNHHTRIYYRVDEKLLSNKKSSIVARAKGKSEAVKAADEATDRARYYSHLQQVEADRLENLEARLGKEFSDLKRELGVLDMKLAKAEVFHENEVIVRLQARKNDVNAAIRIKLEDLGLSERDLEPRRLCMECGDTGVRPDGSFCNCWKERRT